MRLGHSRAPALLLLLPALHVLTAAATEDRSEVSRATVPEYNELDALPSAAPSTPAKAGTKDAPVDGLDGKPQEGPWVHDRGRPEPGKMKADVEDLGNKKLTKEEWDALKAEADISVMDDPERPEPTGVTGTEGGISTKDKERKKQEGKTGEKMEQIPQQPKSALPNPNGEVEGSKDAGTDEIAKKKGAQGLEKPTDLPEKPHDIPHPVSPSSSKDDPLDTTPNKYTGSDPTLADPEQGGVIQPFHSFILSLTMIIFSEIGDKTFLVAALMAMRHERLVVFSAAFSALIAMTILSAVLGHAVPALIPERLTHLAAAILFAVFGVKLLREGLAMSPDEGVGEEMREVEQELEEKEELMNHGSHKISPYSLESGRARRSRSNSRLPAPARSPSSSPSRSPSRGPGISGAMSGLVNLFSLLLSPAWVQTFVMTFLGEWGDRSQIATIAMAAGSDYWWVTAGAVVGHGCCTAVAVIGGRALAGRVSMRVVTLGGAIAFIVFALIYFAETMYHQ